MTNGVDAFTVKEIVVEIMKSVKDLSDKLDRIDRQGSIGTREELGDHETRIRVLESFRLRAAGAIAVLTAALVGLSSFWWVPAAFGHHS